MPRSRKPQVLVLDEVTSALDSEFEAQIQEVIRDLHGSITLIVIAHRISTVLDVDELVVVSQGEIVETGSPKVLLADKESYFSRIAQMQRGEK